MKNTKVYLMSTENVKDPRTFSSWKEFLPKEHWEKTVRPLKEEDRKTELAAWFLLYQALREWGISEEKINADGAYYYGEHGKPMRRNEEICFNLSKRPPETFHEAVQSLWFLFVILHMESNASSFSPGRLDQYLYPYYQKDIEKGILDQIGRAHV